MDDLFFIIIIFGLVLIKIVQRIDEDGGILNRRKWPPYCRKTNTYII